MAKQNKPTELIEPIDESVESTISEPIEEVSEITESPVLESVGGTIEDLIEPIEKPITEIIEEVSEITKVPVLESVEIIENIEQLIKKHRIEGINSTMRTATIVAEGYQYGDEIAIPFQGNENFKLKITNETEYQISY